MKMKDDRRRLPVIGWREWVSLPELGITTIKAKVDTGARSSSLHVFDIETYEHNGTTHVRFKVPTIQRSASQVIVAEAPLLEFRAIRSSSGVTAHRPVIVTALQILGSTWPIELTLANRDEMGFRMLLGREGVRRRLLVDPGTSYYNGRPRQRKR
jgi:hypothetical protein